MGRNELPAAVRRLIERHLDTAADVDTLLLLRRQRDRSWTALAVARELRIDPDQSATILARLGRRGLLQINGDAFRYGPTDAEMDEAVATLAALYPSYRLAVTSLIYSRPTLPVRDFSNAFRLRKDD